MADLADLKPLRRYARTAAIVGLGESVHGAKQQAHLKMRTTRLLVEEMGFRSLAWEEDWTTGVLIDRYVTTGRGDPEALVRRMTGQWQSEQTLGLLNWLRRFNTGREDKVRFVGVEFYYTDTLAYDAIEAYVATHAPTELPRLQRHLNPIRPTAKMPDYAMEYSKIPNKQPFIHHAREVYRLVRALPHRKGEPARALALHHARQILSFHLYYAMSIDAQNVYREVRAAKNLRWWQRRTGDRIAYWAATPHTANAPDLRISIPGSAGFRFPSAGSHLRDWYGAGYVSIGFTLDHGTVGLEPGETTPLGRPARNWFERPLGEQHLRHFVLGLHRSGPAAVRHWMHGPLTTRGLTWAGPRSTMSGGSLAQWFDVLVHTQVVRPLDALRHRVTGPGVQGR